MPINLHVQFFFNTGDLGGGPQAGANVQATSEIKARDKFNIDLDAGKFQAILGKMMLTGVFDRFPSFQFVLTETSCRLGSLLPGGV